MPKALAVFDDDGDGPNPPALYAGGHFTTAGGLAANYIAKWDGHHWSPVGTGMNDYVYALAVFDDDGEGPNPPALYAGGEFTEAGGVAANRIAKWDGTQWSSLGTGTSWHVRALTVFDDDGAGPNPPALYVGGDFLNAGGITVNRIAKWDGTDWSALGTGVDAPLLPDVRALTVFDDDGDGPNPPALYAGGDFDTAGGIPANLVAKWDGTNWSALGDGLAGGTRVVTVLAAFDDDGDGPNPPALYAGGNFTNPGNNIAKWNGSNWSTIDTGTDDWVWSLFVFDDDGTGPNSPALYVGGSFTQAGSVAADNIVKWDGVNWLPLDTGTDNSVTAMAAFDCDGDGPDPPALFTGGFFFMAGGLNASRVAKWDGSQWFPLGNAVNTTIYTLATFDDDDTGPNLAALFMGGAFTTVGTIRANYVAKWDGNDWYPLGDGTNEFVEALVVFDDDDDGPNPPALFVGGRFTEAGGNPANYIAKWDGTAWSTLGDGMDGSVYALAVFDDDGDGPNPPALYAGGWFEQAGGIAADHIAKWDGSSWAPLDVGMNYSVYALTVHDDDDDGPNPPALYAGGHFTTAGGITANKIAKWDGTNWSSLGLGVEGDNAHVRDLAVFDDDGTGPNTSALYAGGYFTQAGSSPANYVAKWDGTNWSPLSTGIGGDNPHAEALVVFDDDGVGPNPSALYAAGKFTTAGAVSATSIAKWNGSEWSPLDTGLNELALVRALVSFDPDDTGPVFPTLFAGGTISTAGGISSANIAAWGRHTVASDFDCDGDVDGQDFMTFSSCFNGSLRPPKPTCQTPYADFDDDNDVDGQDFMTFAPCFNGSLRPPKCP